MKKDRILKKGGILKYLWRHKVLYLMLIPMILYFLVFNYYPMLGLQIAFKDWNPWLGIWGSPWATNALGELDLFSHFRTLFEDPQFWQKFWNTIRISLLKTIFSFSLPIVVVILLNELTSLKFKKAVQTVSYLPHFISWVIIAGILFSMAAADSAFQNFLASIFGREIYFFSDDRLFLFILVLSDIWKGLGWGTIIYLAALASIPAEMYEAAAIDGANRWQKTFFITLPGMMPAITIRLIFELSGLTNAGFDQVFNLYNSAVFGMGDILETWLFRLGVVGGRYDISTALGLFNSLIALVLTVIANKMIKVFGGSGIW